MLELNQIKEIESGKPYIVKVVRIAPDVFVNEKAGTRQNVIRVIIEREGKICENDECPMYIIGSKYSEETMEKVKRVWQIKNLEEMVGHNIQVVYSKEGYCNIRTTFIK